MADKSQPREATPDWLLFAKEQQQSLKLSQAAIAEEAKTSTATISDLWNGKQTTSEAIASIERVLQMKPVPAEWGLIARRALRDGYFDQLMEWLVLGLRCRDLGILGSVYDLAEQRAIGKETDTTLEGSREIRKRPVPLRTDGASASDPTDKKGHGPAKPRAR